VFAEKESGTRSDRKALAKALEALGEGDVLVVCKLDRLARSTRDLLNVLDAVAKRGAGFKVLDNPTLDTTQAHGWLLLQLLAIIGEFERTLIISGTAEGRIRAKARGVRFGRKLSLSRFQIEEALKRRAAGETTRDIARTFGVSHSTVSRL
jgi:DNA invertase Pin-like site-specific DNA recombinase